jgi:ABC-type branched-subunit amino acid transport system substrate-binding protein
MASAALRPQAWPERSRWTLKRWTLFVIAAAALSGCVPRARPVEPPPQPERPVEQPRPVQPSRLPADETRNRIAVLVPLTGRDAALGQSILNAANLALLDTGGERIRITAYDTAAGAVPAANEALAEGSGLILGPLLAEDVRAVAPIARRADVPVVAFSNDISVAGDGVYVMGLNPGQSIQRVVAFARSRGASRFGGLVPANTYGERSARALTQAVEGEGGRIVGIQTFDASPTGVRAAATRLAGQGPADAVLVADVPRAVLPAMTVIREVSPSPRLLATERWATETGIGVNAALRGTWFAAPSDANYNAFRLRYRARYSAMPYRLASLGYDAVLLVVRVAADWPVGRPFPARALRDPGGFAGVDGAFRFGRDGIAERALEVREVNATGTIVVSPAPRGF